MTVVLGTWAAAVFALFIVFGRKGTWRHRWTGRGYVVAIIVVGFGVLGMQDGYTSYTEMTVAAFVGVTLVLVGIYAIRGPMSYERKVSFHGHAMVLSVIGLLVVIASKSANAIGAPVGWVAAGVAVLGIVVLAFSPMRRVLRRFTNQE